jgi:hypothetical protein
MKSRFIAAAVRLGASPRRREARSFFWGARGRLGAVGFGLAVLAAACWARADAAPAGEGCLARGEDSAVVAQVTPRLEIALDDKRLMRLAGLAPVAPDFPETEVGRRLRGETAARWVGTPVLVVPTDGVDRWGRTGAMLFSLADGLEMGEALLAAGAVQIGEAREAPDCAVARRAAETRAREAGLGLWSEAYYRPLQALDRAGLLARAGEFALVEGRIRRVGQGRRRIFLDFGLGRDGFSVTTTRRSTETGSMTDAKLQALIGRSVRARGVIETIPTPAGLAPRMAIESLWELERLDAGAAEGAP